MISQSKTISQQNFRMLVSSVLEADDLLNHLIRLRMLLGTFYSDCLSECPTNKVYSECFELLLGIYFQEFDRAIDRFATLISTAKDSLLFSE